jgi:hypothetical protein
MSPSCAKKENQLHVQPGRGATAGVIVRGYLLVERAPPTEASPVDARCPYEDSSAVLFQYVSLLITSPPAMVVNCW